MKDFLLSHEIPSFKESINYKYMFISYFIDNLTEKEEIISYLIDNGFNWLSSWYETNSNKNFPLLLLINLISKVIMYVPYNSKMPQRVKDDKKLYDKIYDKNSIIDLKSIVKYGIVIPSYKSRKIIREGLYDNYSEVAYLVQGIEEQNEILNYLYDQGYDVLRQSILDGINNYHNQFIIFPNKRKNIEICSDSEESIKSYVYNANSVFKQKLYDKNILQDFKSVIEYGKEIKRPNYKSRKIIRESKEDGKYDILIIKIESVEEYAIFDKRISHSFHKENCSNIGNVGMNYSVIIINDNIRNDNGTLLHKYNMYGSDNYNISPIFTINDLDKIEMFIKYGILRPSYKSRKIIREFKNFKK